MSFLEDIKPIITGPLGRLLALYVEVIVFALALPAGMFIIRLIIFGLCFFLAILDGFLVYQRWKLRRTARSINKPYTFQPKIWVFTLDFIFAFLFTGLWIMSMIGGGYGYDFVGGIIFPAYSMIGALTIAQLHWIFGGVECHLFRQMKSGKIGAMRAHNRDASRDGAVVDLS